MDHLLTLQQIYIYIYIYIYTHGAHLNQWAFFGQKSCFSQFYSKSTKILNHVSMLLIFLTVVTEYNAHFLPFSPKIRDDPTLSQKMDISLNLRFDSLTRLHFTVVENCELENIASTAFGKLSNCKNLNMPFSSSFENCNIVKE